MRVVVGNVRGGKFSPPVRSGERVVGQMNGMPIVLKRPRGRYVYDAETGAIQLEHDIGPHAQEAVTKLEGGLKSVEQSLGHLQETVKRLQQPAQRTAVVVAGTIAAGLVVAAVVYYIAQQDKK